MSSFLVPACAVCFGDPNALSSKALTLGVFLLAGVVGFVLVCIGWTAFVWARRARRLGAAE